jgi:hypothetical protein
MDLKNLISRIELAASLGVEPRTWQRLDAFVEIFRSFFAAMKVRNCRDKAEPRNLGCRRQP